MSCRKVANKRYCIADTNIDCDSDFYKKEVVTVNLIIVIFISVVVPLILIVNLTIGKKNNKLVRIHFLRKFGILFMELK